jgi:hypothetical protein
VHKEAEYESAHLGCVCAKGRRSGHAKWAVSMKESSRVFENVYEYNYSEMIFHLARSLLTVSSNSISRGKLAEVLLYEFELGDVVLIAFGTCIGYVPMKYPALPC